MGWHRVNRQEELLEKGEVAGVGRAEGSSATETEGELPFHSCLTLMEQMFTSLTVHSLKVHM